MPVSSKPAAEENSAITLCKDGIQQSSPGSGVLSEELPVGTDQTAALPVKADSEAVKEPLRS